VGTAPFVFGNADSLSKSELEESGTFAPRFDGSGLIPAIVTDAAHGGVLMFAHMNGEALRMTLETGEVHFWSRSREALWKKGESSGNRLMVKEIRTDCDQDVLWVQAHLSGTAVCHTGRTTCFYRRLVVGEAEVVLDRVAHATDE
jgi:phosphoribosyl-AMP cyclohydrolase